MDNTTNYAFVTCRAMGHAWNSFRRARGAKGERQLHTTCLRCGTYRRDTLGWRGDVIQRSYKKPEGYALRGLGDDAPTRQDWRRTMFEAMPEEERP